jgi:3-hydroxyacyl-CoA dehydrogenase/enoyl-CoA hydratase/3-hydroxybutyryl-CoA epimerase
MSALPSHAWRLDVTDDIAALTLDVPGQSANTLSATVLGELEQLLIQLEAEPLRGLMILSAKRAGFIAGADIREFEHIDDAAHATELAQRGQRVFARLAGLPFPSVAVVHGYCLGGGLELALACTYRVARDDGSTRLGLPEVRLGINPGFGGTVRLPPLVGVLPALDMMLSGRTVAARAARRIGLVDDAVPERHLRRAAIQLLRRRAARRRAPWLQRLLATAPLRPMVVKLLTRKLAVKANPDHYPAPYRILDLWARRANEDEEAASLGELLVSRTSRNLVHIFLLGERAKRAARTEPHQIEYVHVIGAGVMGADIALWAAHRGFRVSLQDQRPEILARAMKRAHDFYTKKHKDPRAVQETMDRLMPDLAGNGLRRADLVIEAIVEKLEPKRSLLGELERKVRPGTLIATNTSSIRIEDIASALSDPTRFVGLHFFNPVPKMQLVEIVRGAQSGETALARARAFTLALDRFPLDVKSSPGFLVNRILMPYLIEAVVMVEEGISPAHIDESARAFGMPMGPVELADTVGLDICLSVAEELAGPLNTPVPEALRRKVTDGKLGKKSGEGFYRWDVKGGSHGSSGAASSETPVTERLVLRLLNEAVACLREGVVTHPDAVDLGMVYGTGFAPYLGGPMRYVAGLGETGVAHSLYRLAQEYGTRFSPDPGWSQPELFRPEVPT